MTVSTREAASELVGMVMDARGSETPIWMFTARVVAVDGMDITVVVDDDPSEEQMGPIPLVGVTEAPDVTARVLCLQFGKVTVALGAFVDA